MKNLESTICAIELVGRNHFRVNFKTKEGIYAIVIREKKFYPGEKYSLSLNLGELSPDFVGDDPKKMKIGTCSYEIQEIKNKNGEIVYP